MERDGQKGRGEFRGAWWFRTGLYQCEIIEGAWMLLYSYSLGSFLRLNLSPKSWISNKKEPNNSKRHIDHDMIIDEEETSKLGAWSSSRTRVRSSSTLKSLAARSR